MKAALIGGFLWAVSVLAQADRAADQLAARLAEYRSFSAQFEQQVMDEQGMTLSAVTGQLAMAQGDRFRWETDTPFRQIIVADGEVLWVYDPDLEQVQVRSLASALNASVASILSADAQQLEARFVVDETQISDARIFSLTSRATDDVTQQINLIFRGARLTGIEVLDALGQLTQLSFVRMELGSVDPKQFQFDPPAEADVIYALDNPVVP